MRGSGQAALLAALLLSSFRLPSHALDAIHKEVSITCKPPNPALGQEVPLTPGGNLGDAISCTWYKGKENWAKCILTYYLPPNKQGQVNGSAYTGRELLDFCSLQICSSTSGDSGNYKLLKEGDVAVIGYITINVTDSRKKASFSGLALQW